MARPKRAEPFSAWVLRANLTGFTAGCKLLLPDIPRFGDLVKAQVHSDLSIFGLIYDIAMGDDLVVRQLIVAGDLKPEVVADQRENRLVPIELGVLTVGVRRDQQISQGLPPQPPVSLDALQVCDEAELSAFTGQFDYFQLVLNAPQVPADELLAANLSRAAAARPPGVRDRYLVQAGRELARLLPSDLRRLEGILWRIKPRGDVSH